MDNFDLRKYLAEGKLHENKLAQKLRDEAKHPDSKVGAAIFNKYADKVEKADKGDYPKLIKAMENELISKHPDTFSGEDDIPGSFLRESELNEAMSPQDVVDIADTVAEEFTKESAEDGDFLIYTVGKMEGEGFELDTDVSAQTPDRIDTRGVGEGWGGIFRIKPTADGYEVRNAEKGGLVATIDSSGNFRMLSAAESRAELEGEPDMDRYNDEPDFNRYMEEGEEEDTYFDSEGNEYPNITHPGAIGNTGTNIIDLTDIPMDEAKDEEMNENKPSNKMKKSELKEMIRAAMLAETKISEDVDMIPAEKLFSLIARDLKFSPLVQDDVMLSKEQAIEIMKHVIAIEQSDISPEAALGEYIANGEFEEAGDIPGFEGTKDALDSLSLREEEDEDVEVAASNEEEIEMDEPTDEEPVEDAGEVDVEDDAKVELTGDKAEVSDNLEAALEAARSLGDEKLVDQIGNTITFFTRAHIVKEDELQDEAEEMLQESLRMKRLAGLIK